MGDPLELNDSGQGDEEFKKLMGEILGDLASMPYYMRPIMDSMSDLSGGFREAINHIYIAISEGALGELEVSISQEGDSIHFPLTIPGLDKIYYIDVLMEVFDTGERYTKFIITLSDEKYFEVNLSKHQHPALSGVYALGIDLFDPSNASGDYYLEYYPVLTQLGDSIYEISDFLIAIYDSNADLSQILLRSGGPVEWLDYLWYVSEYSQELDLSLVFRIYLGLPSGQQRTLFLDSIAPMLRILHSTGRISYDLGEIYKLELSKSGDMNSVSRYRYPPIMENFLNLLGRQVFNNLELYSRKGANSVKWGLAAQVRFESESLGDPYRN